MRQQLKLALGLAGIVVAAHAAANVTFYERQGFRGQAFTAGDNVGDLTKFGFNDRASSAVVDNGRWEVCEDIKYRGKCVVLRPGSYDSLQSMGLNNSISSVRPFSGASQAYEATPHPKLVVAAGECACTGGMFRDSYAVSGPLSTLLPVDVTIPGCPPPPIDLLKGILTALRVKGATLPP